MLLQHYQNFRKTCENPKLFFDLCCGSIWEHFVGSEVSLRVGQNSKEFGVLFVRCNVAYLRGVRGPFVTGAAQHPPGLPADVQMISAAGTRRGLYGHHMLC